MDLVWRGLENGVGDEDAVVGWMELMRKWNQEGGDDYLFRAVTDC
jgi:hypothetical protein